jgi:hypothetical protein
MNNRPKNYRLLDQWLVPLHLFFKYLHLADLAKSQKKRKQFKNRAYFYIRKYNRQATLRQNEIKVH